MKRGFFEQVVDDMENGIYNFCKDGKCIGCGNCCSNILPISNGEIKDIERYVKKHKIKATVRTNPLCVKPEIDLCCPFLDDSKDCDKCKIYPVRPMICRTFKCDTPPSKIGQNKKESFWKNRKGHSMRELFFGKGK